MPYLRSAGLVCAALGLAAILALPSLPAQAPAAGATRGSFRILVDGKEVGREDFAIERQAGEVRARGRLALTVGKERVEENTTLTLSPAHEPRSYEWKRTRPPGPFVRVQFDGTKAALEFPLDKSELDQREFIFETPQVTILDNNFFHHYFFLLQHYDFARGGAQSLRVLIPQEVLPAIVTVEDRGPDATGPPGLRQFRMLSEDNEVWLWIDEKRELVRLTVPQAQVEVIRSER